MIVCYFGTYRDEYARNQIMIEGLRRNGVKVIECHQPLWRGVEDRVQIASGGWLRPGFWLRAARTYLRLLAQFRKTGTFDVLVVGYPGHYDVFIAWLLARWKGKPLVWDVLNSLYLITRERGIHARSRLTGEIIRLLEKWACRLPDMMILDTQRFVEWFGLTHRTDSDRFRLVQIGADERFFQPIDLKPTAEDGRFRIIYYGSYIPNHGVAVIVEAAHHLVEDGVCFEMVGDGPERATAQELAAQHGLSNIQFIHWMEREELTHRIAQSDLVLGVFGGTLQVTLTNNNKIFEGFAMKKPVISAASPALPDNLIHGVHLYLCEPGSAVSLAEGIRTLQRDAALRSLLAENGHEIFLKHFNVTQIGRRFSTHLEELLSRRQTA